MTVYPIELMWLTLKNEAKACVAACVSDGDENAFYLEDKSC